MRTVIGLFPSNQDVTEESRKIKEAGFSEDNMRVITSEGSVKCLLGCEAKPTVIKYTSWGALLGIFVYGIFILVAVWCDCILYPISQLVALGIFIVGILAGTIVGGILGVFIGLAEYEKDTHLYTQGVNFGDKVFVLRTERENVEKAMETLTQIGCLGVQMLPQ
jgi:hypothetical protein